MDAVHGRWQVTALATLHTRLVAGMAALELEVVPEFGAAYLHTRTDLAQKVVLAPGDEALSLGKLGPPQGPGGDIERRIASLDELFRIYVAAYDTTAPGDPKLQYVTTRDLFNTVFAVTRSSYRAFLPVSCKWVVGSVAAPFGAALMMVASVRDSIVDWSEGEALNVAPKKALVTERLVVPSGQE
jgi:hypothetical protein